MAYTPLIEYSMPRIIMLDFPAQDIAKFTQMGFDARRGATGIFDKDKFFFPFAIQDTELLFAQVGTGSFTTQKRTHADGSAEEFPFFRDLIREIWEKGGWTILFIKQNTNPEELSTIGIKRLGVITQQRNHFPESAREILIEVLREHSISTGSNMPICIRSGRVEK